MYVFPKDKFLKLRKINDSWSEVLKQAAVRTSRLESDLINPASRHLVLRHKRAELASEKGDEQAFNLLFCARKITCGQIRPYHEHP